MPTEITSAAHLDTLLSTTTYIIADFHATWCGPCKNIAPMFNTLATTYAAPKKLAFVKVDVDAQSDIARRYRVSAMPTFLVLKNGRVTNTIQGANPGELKRIVEAVAREAKAAPGASGRAFEGKGQTLGGSGAGSGSAAAGGGVQAAAGALLVGNGLVDTVVRFFALYFTSLFSLDAYAAARDSPFSVRAGR